MHWPRFLIFTLVFSGVLYAVNRYAFSWLTRLLPLSKLARRGLTVVLVVSPGAVLLGRLLPGLRPEMTLSSALIAAGIVQLAVVLAVLQLLVVDGVLALARRAPSGAKAAPSLPVTAPLTRREFVARTAASSAFAIGGGTAIYGAFRGRHDYTLEDVPFKLPGLSRKLDGFSIVQLSDIHIGAFTGDGELNAVESIVRLAKPDLIVLTGDLLDHDFRLADQLGRFTRRLVGISRRGVVAISGNHDFYAGIAPIVQALQAAGGRVLQNRGEVVGDGDAGFALLGVDDVWGRRFGGDGPDLERAIASLRQTPLAANAAELPRILLCHNPAYFEHAAGQVSLQLSGHTHGGQVNPLVRPADWLLPHGWVAGHYRYRTSDLYVNRGLGTVGPPARIGAAPEITRIVLTA
jgi:predicted MPP superfamily phosphohydrolase